MSPPARTDQRKRRYAPGLSADTIRAALLDRAEDLFQTAFGPPVRTGAKDWRARENPALAMCMRGHKRGLWMDHSADAGGDLMDLVALVFCGLPSARSDFQRVLKEAARFTGVSGEPVQPVPKRSFANTDDAKQQRYQAALLEALVSRARPMTGSRSEAYLAARGITEIPQEGLNDLPPVPGLPVRSAHLPALVVWALSDDGAVCGGQRILLRDDGLAAQVEVRKPSFGRIAGCPARFAPVQRSSGPASGSLVIAEGPETALAIRQSCHCETWAIFGVSGWKTAPLPPDAKVKDPATDPILAPDRDAPNSPAGRAFTRAVKHHLGERRRFRIAVAPEPEGSKRDLADTLLRAGEDAVRGAIAGAVPPREFLRARKRAAREDKENTSDARQ